MDRPDRDADTDARARRLLRREPPRFRSVVVESVGHPSPRMARVRLSGPDLQGFAVPEPAASVRVLLPSDDGGLVMPTWNGNEFLLPDGTRPSIRTFTPRHLDPTGPALEIDVVLHDDGRASAWASTTAPGDEVAVSGPGRGFDVDDQVTAYLLAGDETALPAISQLLERIPPHATADVRVEISHPDARLELPPHPGATTTWLEAEPAGRPGDALVAAVDADVPEDAHVWVAGEAAAVQRIRGLLTDRGVPRSRTTVRGYWKHGRPGT